MSGTEAAVRLGHIAAGTGATLAALVCAACSAPAAPAASASPPAGSAEFNGSAPPLEPLATLQDLMRYEVDPSADAVWGAVGTVTTRDGTFERRPQTSAEWESLRRSATILLEATNLLVIPGRQVALAPFSSDGSGVLSSAEIQQRLDLHRPEFNARALALRAVVSSELSTINAHDAAALAALGDAMDAACEACHVDNWYPHEVIPQLPANPAPPG